MEDIKNKMQYPRRYHPMLVADDGSEGKMSKERVLSLWAAYDALEEISRKRVISDEMAIKIASFRERFQIPEECVGKITLLIRKKFFHELDDRSFQRELEILLQNFFPQKRAFLSDMVMFLRREVFEIHLSEKSVSNEPEDVSASPEKEKTSQSRVTLPLLEAVSKYQNLGNQALSAEKIRVKSQLDPVRGSLFNWLKYYRDELGIGQHSSVERGQFLFRSENGRKLNPEERERVNLILKSLEENLPLQIDTSRQEILFPKFEYEKVAAPGYHAPAIVQEARYVPAEPQKPVAKPFQPTPPIPRETEVPRPALKPKPAPIVPVSRPEPMPLTSTPEPTPAPAAFFAPAAPAPIRPGGKFLFRQGTGGASVTSKEPSAEPIFSTGSLNVTPASSLETLPSAPSLEKPAIKAGSMSFSFNHVLPAEQAAPAPRVLERAEMLPGSGFSQPLPPLAPRKMNRFRINPVSREE